MRARDTSPVVDLFSSTRGRPAGCTSLAYGRAFVGVAAGEGGCRGDAQVTVKRRGYPGGDPAGGWPLTSTRLPRDLCLHARRFIRPERSEDNLRTRTRIRPRLMVVQRYAQVPAHVAQCGGVNAPDTPGKLHRTEEGDLRSGDARRRRSIRSAHPGRTGHCGRRAYPPPEREVQSPATAPRTSVPGARPPR